jgi:hypothetical protein
MISVFYSFSGYLGSFLFVGLSLLVAAPFVDKQIRETRSIFSKFQHLPDEEEISYLIKKNGLTRDNLRQIHFSDLMKSRYSIWAIVTFTMMGWAIAYQSSSLNVMLTEVHGLDESTSTLVYIIASLGFLTATPIAGLIL